MYLDVAIIQRKAAKTALGHSFAQVSCGLIASKALLEERDAHNASRGGGKSFHWKSLELNLESFHVVEVQAAVGCPHGRPGYAGGTSTDG